METSAKNNKATGPSLCRRLKEAGVKPSLQRLAVLEHLCARYDHPTADMIYAGLHASVPTLSKTTVYNTLRLFCEAGLACSLNLDAGNQRFDGQTHRHDHFICRHCGRVFDVPAADAKAGSRAELPAGLREFEVFRTEVSYFGLCADCKDERNRE